MQQSINSHTSVLSNKTRIIILGIQFIFCMLVYWLTLRKDIVLIILALYIIC